MYHRLKDDRVQFINIIGKEKEITKSKVIKFENHLANLWSLCSITVCF